MKIYTKKGDAGETSLIGGTRVPKDHLRVEAYGTVDELNSYLGWLNVLDENTERTAFVKNIQDLLFLIGSHLASDPSKKGMDLPNLVEKDIEALELAMDQMNEVLPEMKNFILPGGNKTSSLTHVARCVCRRAERLVVAIDREETVDPLILKFLNRLSDYLFVLSRMIGFEQNSPEIKWISRS